MSVYLLDELLTVVEKPLSSPQRLALLAGLVLPRWIERGVSPARSLEWHLGRLRRAHELDQLAIFFDTYGRHASTLVWARLDDESEASMLNAGADAIEPHAQADDGHAWILDIDTRFGAGKAVLKRVRALLTRRCEDVAYVRHKGTRRIAKRLTVGTGALQRDSTVLQIESPFLRTDWARQLLHEVHMMIDHAIHLGECYLLLSKSPLHCARALPAVDAAVRGPLMLGQCVRVRSPKGVLSGLLTFGWLTEDGARRLRTEGPMALCPACFNEGTMLVGLAGWVIGEEAEAALTEAIDDIHPRLPCMLDEAGLPPSLVRRLSESPSDVLRSSGAV
jgi:hemolysin-activating ACP:hemolysin acyltransferase